MARPLPHLLARRHRGYLLRVDGGRLAAAEARIEADLALGRHDALVAELEQLAAGHPVRERLHGQLMLALYRSGRQADALAAYRRVRDLLAGELGIDPGEPLRRLHAAVLAQDPALDWHGDRETPPEGQSPGADAPAGGHRPGADAQVTSADGHRPNVGTPAEDHALTRVPRLLPPRISHLVGRAGQAVRRSGRGGAAGACWSSARRWRWPRPRASSP